MNDFFIWIAENYNEQNYLIATKIQGSIWSIADFGIAYACLLIASLVKRKLGKRRIVLRYIILWSTLIMIVLLNFVNTSHHFYLLDCFIIAIHMILIVSVIIIEGKDINRYIPQVHKTLFKRPMSP